MSTRQNLEAGRNYLEKRITVPIDDLAWNEPHNQDVSELTVTRRDKKKTYVIPNLDLEDIQRRNSLDLRAEIITQDFA